MPTEKKEQEAKIVSKKHQARVDKERKQKKVLLISIISVLIVVVLLIAYGILSKTVLLQHRTVAKVNNDKISVTQFQTRVRYERYSLTQTFESYVMSGFGTYLQSYLLQIQNKLDSYLDFGSSVLDNMISEKLIVQKAQELGITVSDDEINKELEENFGYYANGTPTPAATVEYLPTSTYSPTQLALLAPAVTATEEPTATEQAVEATPDLTLTPAADAGTATVTVTPTATEALPTSTPTLMPTATEILPTATPYTHEGYQTLYATVVANLSEQTNFSDSELRDYVRTMLYKQKLYDYVTKDVATTQDMVWARHILVATEEDAKAVLEKLNAGEDWSTLAAQYSQDTSNSYNGGDLGWIYKGQMVKEFEDAIWAMKIGEISQPIQTSFGYHIIQVLGHEERQLSADELSSAKSTYFQDYLSKLNEEAKIDKNDIWASVVPSDPTIPAEYRISTSG